MGIEDMVGSLEPGKKADLQLIDLKSPHITPTADVTSSLVLYGSTADVDTVMVDGRIVKEAGEIVVADVGEVVSEAQALTDEIWGDLFRVRPELERLVKG
jgi:5-methylthioadenosine/S-adenosylhomocysteine deaminase